MLASRRLPQVGGTPGQGNRGTNPHLRQQHPDRPTAQAQASPVRGSGFGDRCLAAQSRRRSGSMFGLSCALITQLLQFQHLTGPTSGTRPGTRRPRAVHARSTPADPERLSYYRTVFQYQRLAQATSGRPQAVPDQPRTNTDCLFCLPRSAFFIHGGPRSAPDQYRSNTVALPLLQSTLLKSANARSRM